MTDETEQIGYVYLISSNDYKQFYIGSTSVSIRKRVSDHRRSWKVWLKGLRHGCGLYKIYSRLGVDKCIVKRLEKVRYKDIKTLRKCEEHWRKILKCDKLVNMIQAHTTVEERKNQKHQHYLKNKVKYKMKYQLNKEALYKKAKTPVKCECGMTTRKDNLSRHLKTKKHIQLMSVSQSENGSTESSES